MLLDGAKADLVFTDPPYNVAIQGHVSGNGAVQHREFAMASGEMTKAQFTEFLGKTIEHLVAYSRSGSVHYVCMDWRHMGELLTAGEGAYTDLLNLCVWTKNNGGMGSLYRSQHELVFVFKSGTAPTSITCSLDNSAATAPTSGATPASTTSGAAPRRASSSRCTRR